MRPLVALLLVGTGAAAYPRLVQQNAAQSNMGPLLLGFPAPSTPGNTIVVFSATTSPTCTFSDGAGNMYPLIGGQGGTGVLTGTVVEIHFAANISVTSEPLTITANCDNAEVRILEYVGPNRGSPWEAASSISGAAGPTANGSLQVGGTDELLVSFVLSAGRVQAADPAFTSRGNYFGDLVQEEQLPGPGTYPFIATVDDTAWISIYFSLVGDPAIDAGTEPDAGPPVIGPGIQYVQGNGVSANSSAVRVPFPGPSRPGDTVIACAYSFGLCTLDDSLNDAFVNVGPVYAGNGPYAGAFLQIFRATLGDAGSEPVVVELKCPPELGLFISEYTGLAATPYLVDTGRIITDDAGILSTPLFSDAGSTLYYACLSNLGGPEQLDPPFSQRVLFNGDFVADAIVSGPGALAFSARVTSPVWFLDYAAFAGLPQDAAAPDAGTVDGGAEDAGAQDGGVLDGGARDAGPADAGPPDGGARDAGTTDAGTGTGPRSYAVGCGCQADGSACALALLALLRHRRLATSA